jgi:ATP-dependent Lhr-like helicase
VNDVPDQIVQFFSRRGWTVFPFQAEVWRRARAGTSGLLHAVTGSGKTMAVWGAALARELERRRAAAGPARRAGDRDLSVLWITPLRALSADTVRALRESSEGVGLDWTIESRTGDTPAAARARQREQLPAALVTTPESLSVLLSYPGMAERLARSWLCVVDEWHELLGTKRGVQVELALAHLRRRNPALVTWGLSATLGNIEQAQRVLLGPAHPPDRACLVRGRFERRCDMETLLPPTLERFPWAGHIGLRLLGGVLERIERAGTTLLFTNTRGQAEIWFQALASARPQWLVPEDGREVPPLAIHHGSLGRTQREQVERAIRQGAVRCAVCTSSLDLGVDFPPVDQVIQVGSPKGLARLLQRAGRSGHRPGARSRLICVPTHALELVEFAAARAVIDPPPPPSGLDADRAATEVPLEARPPLRHSMDVLCQHLVTLACGDGFVPDELYDEVRATHAFADLARERFDWALQFAAHGGPALTAYQRHARLQAECHDHDPPPIRPRYRVRTSALTRLHRLGIGTITGETAMTVRTRSGAVLGTVEESFIARLRPGDRFVFGGRRLRLLRVREMSAYTEPAPAGRGDRDRGAMPSWVGGRMPLSSELAEQVRRCFRDADAGQLLTPEMVAVGPLLALQKRWSRLPRDGELLIEHARTREGWHAYVYPLEGRLVHEGLAALCAWRLAAQDGDRGRSFSMACGDIGFELHSPTPFRPDEAAWRAALSPRRLREDLEACLNSVELSRRKFRDIARIAGLVTTGYPGEARPSRHVQASSELYFDVFREFDPGNLLLEQAHREVLEQQLDLSRLSGALRRIEASAIITVDTPCLTPLAFPLWADRLREQLTTERWEDRVRRMIDDLEQRANAADVPPRGRADEGPGQDHPAPPEPLRGVGLRPRRSPRVP